MREASGSSCLTLSGVVLRVMLLRMAQAHISIKAACSA
jgi:hypothetical protein